MSDPDYHKMWITVVEAKNLKAADVNGKSDPYVLIKDTKGIKMKGKGAKTKVIDKNLNPTWNETFEFEFNHNLSRLTFLVFDHDKFSSDDRIGKTYAYIENLWSFAGEVDEWFNLSPQGQLRLKIKLQMKYPTINPGGFVPIPTPKFTIGFGWDFPKKTPPNVDEFTDGSVVAINWNKEAIDDVAYNKLKSVQLPGVLTHKGDNYGGGLKGDDEEIFVDTTVLSPTANLMSFVVFVNSYSGQPLSLAKSLYVRIRDGDKTIALARVSHLPKDTGLLFGFIYFSNGQWFFKYTANIVPGKNWQESLTTAKPMITF